MSGRLMLLALVAGLIGGAEPAHAQTFTTYHCRDGTEFVAAFYQGTRSAYLKLDGHTMTLPRRISASGARYSTGGIALRIKGKAATLTRGWRQSTECSAD